MANALATTWNAPRPGEVLNVKHIGERTVYVTEVEVAFIGIISSQCVSPPSPVMVTPMMLSVMPIECALTMTQSGEPD